MSRLLALIVLTCVLPLLSPCILIVSCLGGFRPLVLFFSSGISCFWFCLCSPPRTSLLVLIYYSKQFPVLQPGVVWESEIPPPPPTDFNMVTLCVSWWQSKVCFSFLQNKMFSCIQVVWVCFSLQSSVTFFRQLKKAMAKNNEWVKV